MSEDEEYELPDLWLWGGERGCDLYLYRCGACGAAVDDTAMHEEWHKGLKA